MSWILVAIFVVQEMVIFQDYSTQAMCEQAAKAITAYGDRNYVVNRAFCIPRD